MADTTARQIIYSALIVTALLVGMVNIFANFVTEDNEDYQKFNSTFNKFTEVKNNQEEIYNTTKGATPEDTDDGELGIFKGLLKGTWGSITLLYNSVTTLVTMIASLDTIIPGLPDWFIEVLGALLAITLTFVIMNAIFKWRV